MIEVRDNILYVNDIRIGDETKLVEICEKADKWDELKASFENRGDA